MLALALLRTPAFVALLLAALIFNAASVRPAVRAERAGLLVAREQRWVEHHHGYGIARAGHTDSTGPATTTYIKVNLHDAATALAAMTGQPHPLAHPIQLTT
jgi:hypothetical protein